MRVKNLRQVQYKTYGYFGQAGAYSVFPGGPDFQEVWSYEDFNGGSTWLNDVSARGMRYTPLDNAVKIRAGRIISQLASLSITLPMRKILSIKQFLRFVDLLCRSTPKPSSTRLVGARMRLSKIVSASLPRLTI